MSLEDLIITKDATLETRLGLENREAVFSKDMRYRYSLEITWGDGDICQFIGLNPSTADEMKDDNTVRRCKNFARDWGFSGIVMTNLFAFRATYPRDMKKEQNPIGEKCIGEKCNLKAGQREFQNVNDIFLAFWKETCARTVAAWGNHGLFMGRSQEFRKWFGSMMCFRITKAGQPEHPLYMPNSIKLIAYES